jgi:hypothetical protein
MVTMDMTAAEVRVFRRAARCLMANVHYETKGPRACTMLVDLDGGVLASEPTRRGSLDRVIRKAMRRGIIIDRVEVFDWENIVTKEDAERRARELWGDRPLLVTQLHDRHSRPGDGWAEWLIDVSGDYRAHVLDGQGRVICKHSDCLKEAKQ